MFLSAASDRFTALTQPSPPCQTGNCIEIVELPEHEEYLEWLCGSWMQETQCNAFITVSSSSKWAWISDWLSGIKYFQHWLECFSSQLLLRFHGSHLGECSLGDLWKMANEITLISLARDPGYAMVISARAKIEGNWIKMGKQRGVIL